MNNQKTLIVTRKDRASALVAVIIFGAILSICATYAYRSTIYQTRMAARSHDYLSALNVAEAGAELAMLELNKTTNAFGGWTGSEPVQLTQIISNDQGEQVGEAVVQVGNLGTNPRVISTGYVPNKANSTVERTVQLNTKSNTAPAPWGEFGLFAFGNLSFSGNQTVGSFANGEPDTPTQKANVASLGNITFSGTQNIYGNVQADGNVNVTWGTSIFGDVLYGGSYWKPEWFFPEYTAKQSSLRRPDIKELPVPPENPMHGFNNSNISIYDKSHNKTTKGLSNGGKLTPANSDITIPAPGVYHFSSLKPSGTSTISIVGTGDVKIYTDSAFDLSSMAQFTIGNNGNGNGPDVTIVSESFTPSNYAEFNVNDSSQLNLFADKMTFSSGSKLYFNDDSSGVITAAEVSFAGNNYFNVKSSGKKGSLAPGNPGNLIIYASEKANFGAGAHVAGVFYGPNVDAKFSGGMDWWGAVIGNNITISGGPGLRIDEGLFTPTGGSGTVVTAWTETAPKRI